MSYVVRIVGPAGRETYLTHGRETSRFEHATRYPHPSSARRARDAWIAKNVQRVCVTIEDAEHPEREVTA